MKRLPLWLVCILATTLVPYSAWKDVEFVAWAAGTVRYVDSTAGACTGNYSIASRNCTGSDGNSYATINAAVAAMAAGDITYVRTGTYTDSNINLPTGVSALVPSVLQAYQNDLVTIRPLSGTRVIYNTGRAFQKYWNLDLDGVNQTSDGVKLDAGSHGLVLGGDMTAGGAYRCKIRNATNMGFSLQGISDNVTVSGCDIFDNGLTIPSPYAHGLYIQKGVGFILEKSRVRRNGCNGIQLYGASTPQVTFATIRRNQFYDNARVSGCGTQVYLANDDHIFEYNHVWNDIEVGNTYGVRVELITPARTIIRHNSLYNAGTNGISIVTGAVDIVVQNNLVIGSTNAIVNNGTNTTLTDNLTSGTASSIFTSIVSGSIDLSLKAGSTPIDGGTAIGGTANGTPDQGAHEVPKFSSCTVEAAATSVVRVTFTNNLRPPMLPLSGVTGVTFRKNGSNNAVVSSAKISDNVYGFTVTNAYAGGDTVDVSIVPASTNLTDSALIGNTNNQPFISTVTNTACTNNAAVSPSHTYTQARFELHSERGLEAAPIILPHGLASTGGAENFANYKIRPGAKIRPRFAVVCGGADCPISSFHPYFSTGGAYAVINDTFGANNIKMCGLPSGTDMPINASATTDQLSTGGTFAPGGIVFTANDVPEITGLNNGYKTEMEYCVETDTDATEAFDIRLYLGDGTAFTDGGGAYTVTPRLVSTPTSAGSAQ